MLEVRLLGAPEFAFSGSGFRFAAPPRTLPLLAWLLLHRRAPLVRDGVAFAFWPDATEDEARGDLRRHLYYLSKALPAPNGAPWLATDKKTVAWNPKAPVAFDVADFERACGDGAFDEAVALYRGPFLDGLDDEWIEPERERLKSLAEHALLRLIARDGSEAPERAIGYAQQLLRVDPWREDAVRALIELRHRSGDRAGALREYVEFAERLRLELDVAPMAETTAAYDAVARADAPLPVRVAVAAAPAAPRTNLPARVDALVGRDESLAAIAALLAETRIATLVGTGGVGKTRLAIEAGHAAQGGFGDGVWYADCAPLGEPALVVGALASAVGFVQPERPELGTLLTALRHKHVLLVIDNCEHLVGEVARVATALVGACPDVRILATSREPLGVRGERVFRVPSLDVPPAFETLSPAQARRFGAVALFELRARAVAPAFALDAQNTATVVDICRRLDGIALAIELAAARVAVLAPDELARRLDERFRVLTGGERTALPRQRTMRALIDWSWDLSTEDERTLLRRLAIFAGSFGIAAVEGVAVEAPLDPADAVTVCGGLAEKSLIVADSGSGSARYRLLESIRAYALEKLSASGERDAVAQRCAAWFANVAGAVDDTYQSTPDAAWYARASADLDNVRAVLAWSLGDGHNAVLGATIASAFGTVWQFGSSAADRRWLDRAYEKLDRAAHPALTARLIWQIAAISRGDGRHASWVAAAVRHDGDTRTRAEAFCWLADVAVRERRFADADGFLADALALDDATRRPKTHAALLRVRGELATGRGDFDEGLALLERALAASRGCGASAVAAAAQVALAEAAFAAGDARRSVVIAVEARATVAQTFGRTLALADASGNLAAYHVAAGDLDAALAAAREALAIARDLDFPPRIAAFVELLAVIAGLRGETERAAFLLGFAEAERRRRDMPRGTTERAGYERLLERLERLAPDERERRLAGGAVAGLDRAVAEAHAI